MNTMATVVFPDNPFAILGVGVAADRGAIAQAHEDALFDAHDSDEARLERARQDIMTPRTRLEAELGFFPALGTDEVNRLLADLRAQGRSDLAQGFTGLDRANYMALHCRPGMGTRGVANARALANHHDSIVPEQVHALIGQARQRSGFGPVAQDDFDRAFADWRQRHARLVLNRFDENGPMAAHVGKLVATRDRQGLACGLIPALLREYEARQAGPLEEQAQAVRAALARIDADAPAERVEALARALRHWASLAEPLQQADALRGIDEAHSQALFEAIRSHSLDLANNHKAPAQALAISRLAHEAFASLPEAAAKLAEDIAILEKLARNAPRANAFRRNLPPARQSAPQPDRAPANTRSDTDAQAEATPGWRPGGLARVAVLIFALILWIIRATVAMARLLVDRWGNRARWGIAGVVALLVISAMHNRPPASYSPPETSADVATPDTVEMPRDQAGSGYESPGYPVSAPVLPVAPQADGLEAVLSQDAPLSPNATLDDGREIMPAAYATAPLGLSELRYCLKQKARLEAVQSEIADSTQNDRFNAAVEAYNPRCGRFSYDRTDMSTIEAEMRSQGSQLHAQGLAILEGNTP